MFNYNIHNASIYYQAMEYVSKRFKDAAKLEEINGFGLPLYYWMDQAQKNHVKIVDQEFIRIKLTDPLKVQVRADDTSGMRRDIDGWNINRINLENLGPYKDLEIKALVENTSTLMKILEKENTQSWDTADFFTSASEHIIYKALKAALPNQVFYISAHSYIQEIVIGNRRELEAPDTLQTLFSERPDPTLLRIAWHFSAKDSREEENKDPGFIPPIIAMPEKKEFTISSHCLPMETMINEIKILDKNGPIIEKTVKDTYAKHLEVAEKQKYDMEKYVDQLNELEAQGTRHAQERYGTMIKEFREAKHLHLVL